MKKYKTTEKDFKVFKEEFEYWVKYFGLFEYKYVIEHRDAEDSLAIVYFPKKPSDRVFRVNLSIDWDEDEPTDYEVKKSAFHEACEVLFFEIGELAHEGYGRDKERNSVHRLIRILENTIFEDKHRERELKADSVDRKADRYVRKNTKRSRSN